MTIRHVVFEAVLHTQNNIIVAKYSGVCSYVKLIS